MKIIYKIEKSEINRIYSECKNLLPYEAKGLIIIDNNKLILKPIYRDLFKNFFKLTINDIKIEKNVIGCFHSHTNCSPILSKLDRQNIGKLGLHLWLIFSVPNKSFRVYEKKGTLIRKCKLIEDKRNNFFNII